MLKGIIFDFNRTLYDPEEKALFSGVKELLRSLRQIGLKLGLLSYGGYEKEKLLRDIGLIPFFDWYKITPEKTLYEFSLFMKSLRLEPAEVLVVGDLLTEEIRLGNELGAKTVWINRGSGGGNLSSSSDVNYNYTIKQISELLPIVKLLMW